MSAPVDAFRALCEGDREPRSRGGWEVVDFRREAGLEYDPRDTVAMDDDDQEHPRMLLTRSLAPLNRRDSGVAARSPPRLVIGPGTRDSQPRAAHRDRYWWRIRTQTWLEVASGSRLRSCAACLLLSGALRSAEIAH
jgi:hypothetical protein